MTSRQSPAIVRMAWTAALVLLRVTLPAWADKTPEPVRLTATDITGKAVAVPHATQPTLLLFLRISQEQSRTILEDAKRALDGAPPTQVVVVLSGTLAAEDVKAFAAKVAWPIVRDPDYKIVGTLVVRVWPISVVLSAKGLEVARMAGLPQSYGQDMSAYLAFAAGKIDKETLRARLSSSSVVADSPYQVAARHVRVALRLLAKDMIRQAQREVAQGLKAAPKDERLLLMRARVLLLLRDPVKALDALSHLDGTSALSARIGVLKGGALVALKRYDEAIAILESAAKLNPDPAEAQYYLGVAYQGKSQPDKAARAFRLAFEATPLGRPLTVGGASPLPLPTVQPKAPPATQPATQPGKGPATK